MVDTDTAPTTAPAPGVGPRRALGPARRTIREVGLALIVGGFIVLLFVVYQLFGTTLTEQHDQHDLANSFRSALAHRGAAPVQTPSTSGGGTDSPTVSGQKAVTNLSPSTPTGSAIEHLVIPAIGVDKYVVQGTDEQDLMEGPGHYIGTPFPGQKGNAAIAGHRTTYGAPFFKLNELTRGDRIYVTNAKGRTFVFRVVGQVIAQPTGPSATAVLADTSNAQLTLTTCNPRFEAINRLVVVADLVGRAVPAAVASPTRSAPPSAAAAPVAAPANLGSGTSSGWPPAIAFGAAVVVLWVLTRLAVMRTRRWRRAGSLVVGIVVCAVPLWFCFENVVRILPPSI